MIVGTEVIISYSPLSAWNGSRGRIRSFFTLHSGNQAAIIRLDRIALEVVFPVAELEAAEEVEA